MVVYRARHLSRFAVIASGYGETRKGSSPITFGFQLATLLCVLDIGLVTHQGGHITCTGWKSFSVWSGGWVSEKASSLGAFYVSIARVHVFVCVCDTDHSALKES